MERRAGAGGRGRGRAGRRHRRGAAARGASPSTSAYDGAAALDRLGVNDYDVVVLDRDLPGVHGDEVCRHPGRPGRPDPGADADRRRPTVDDRVDGLALGADDYLAKPFAFASWWPGCGPWPAGRRRRCRRCWSAPASRLDPARREATRGGHFLRLTRKEFGVLEELLRADGAVVSRRGPAGAGLGRAHRPVHQHRPGDDDEAAPQARRPAADRDRAGVGYRLMTGPCCPASACG